MRQLTALILFILAAYLVSLEWELLKRDYTATLAIDTPQLRLFGGVVLGMAGLIIYQD